MRMFFGFLLLVSFIGEVFADDICSQDLVSSHPCPAGKYYDSDQDECWNCPAGYYCPGTDANPDTGMAYCCNTHTHGMFPYSDEGNASIVNCYTNVSCTTENDTQVSCLGYNSDNDCFEEAPRTYTAQIYYDTTNYDIRPEKQFQELNLSPASVPEGYHIESIPHYDAPPQNHTFTWFPKSYTFECVPNTKPCKYFFPSDDMPKNCYQYTDQQKCEAARCDWSDKYNKCMLFDQIGAYHTSLHCTSANDISGDAIWDAQTNTWIISQCKCTDTGLYDDTDKLCSIKDGIHNPIITGDLATVHLTNEHIIFNENITTGEDSSCVKCFQDTNDTKYYVASFSNGIVESCGQYKSNNARGYYRNPPQSHQDYCGGTTEWPENLQANPCPKEECPTGKTTTDILPIGAASCKYTTDTQFCDAKGCFNLNDINDWTFSQ